MAAPGERILAAEMLAALTIGWIGHAVTKAGNPSPSDLMGVVLAYAALAGVAMFGPQPAKVAAGLGALVLLTIAVREGPNALSGVTAASGRQSLATGSAQVASISTPTPALA
jgi:hypothetical protein